MLKAEEPIHSPTVPPNHFNSNPIKELLEKAKTAGKGRAPELPLLTSSLGILSATATGQLSAQKEHLNID